MKRRTKKKMIMMSLMMYAVRNNTFKSIIYSYYNYVTTYYDRSC